MRQEEENRPLRIYQCEDTQNGILTAVYEAGISGYGHKYIRIAPRQSPLSYLRNILR